MNRRKSIGFWALGVGCIFTGSLAFSYTFDGYNAKVLPFKTKDSFSLTSANIGKQLIDRVSQSRGLSNKAFFKNIESNNDWLFSKLDSLGFQPKKELFKLPIWQQGKHELEIVPYKSDNFVPFDAVSMAFSKARTDTSGFLINAGSASAAEINALSKELNGNIAFFAAPLPDPFLPQINKRLADALLHLKRKGAAGAIMYGSQMGRTIPAIGLPFSEMVSNFPCSIIAQESAEEIKKWMGQERLMAFFHARHLITKFEQQSLFFQLNDKLKDRVLVFARYDVAHKGNLFNTNLYGSALALSLAEHLKDLPEAASLGLDVVLCPSLDKDALPYFLEERLDKFSYQALIVLEGAGQIRELSCPVRLDVEQGVKGLLASNLKGNALFSSMETSMRYYGPYPLGKYIMQGVPIIQPMLYANLEQMEQIHYQGAVSLLADSALFANNVKTLEDFLLAWASKKREHTQFLLSKRRLRKWQNKNTDQFYTAGLLQKDSISIEK